MFKRKVITRGSKRQGAPRRGIYILPNLFTTASIFGGFFALIMAMEGNFVYACLAIIGSFICDGLDGKVARATNAVSRFGVEFDSLADLVAFGVAPAVCVYIWGLQGFGRLAWLAGFLFVTCGAMRLARFNVQVEKVGTSHFVGLPIPAAACTIVATILFAESVQFQVPEKFLPILILTFVLSFLMVSSIPYMSFKEMRISRLKPLYALIIILVLIILAIAWPQGAFFVFMFGYVLLGPLGARYTLRKKNRLLQEAAAQSAAGEAALWLNAATPPDTAEAGETAEEKPNGPVV